MFDYDPEVLEALSALGIVPQPHTTPERAKDAAMDLYRYELRRLRDRLLRREIPKGGYSDRVIGLRRRYWMLSVPLDQWAKEK
jgi:hypothetical protein